MTLIRGEARRQRKRRVILGILLWASLARGGGAPEDLLEPAPSQSGAPVTTGPLPKPMEGPAPLSPPPASRAEELPLVTIEAVDRSLFLGKREMEFHLDPALGVARGSAALSKTGLEGPTSGDLGRGGSARRPLFLRAGIFGGSFQNLRGAASLGIQSKRTNLGFWGEALQRRGSESAGFRESLRGLAAGAVLGLGRADGLDFAAEFWGSRRGRFDILGPEPGAERWGGSAAGSISAVHAKLPVLVRTAYRAWSFPAERREEISRLGLELKLKPVKVKGSWEAAAQVELGSEGVTVLSSEFHRPWEIASVTLSRHQGTWDRMALRLGVYRFGRETPEGGPLFQDPLFGVSASGALRGPALGYEADAGLGRLSQVDFEDPRWMGLRLRLNPGLAPERTRWHGKLRLNKPLGAHALSLGLGGEDRRGVIVGVAGPVPGTSVLANGGPGWLATGLVDWKSCWGALVLDLSYSCETPEKGMGDLPLRARHLGQGSLAYKRGRAGAGLKIAWLGPRRSTFRDFKPAAQSLVWATWRATAFLGLRAEIQNLGGDGPFQDGLREEPLSLWVGAEGNF